MNTTLIPTSRPASDLAVDAMINEGGALRQPSMRDTAAVLARLRHGPLWHKVLLNPMTVFWASFAASLVIALLDNRPVEKK